MDSTETVSLTQEAIARLREIAPHVIEAAAAASPSPYMIGASLTATPEDEGQVSRILKWAGSSGCLTVPRGGGTKDALGNVAKQADLILSMKKMSGILQHSAGDLMVTALPGTTLDEVQNALRSEGQFLPLDPGHARTSTLGGIVASAASGPKRAMYGTVRDHLIATRVVMTDGTVIRTGAKVVKNVAGYDMNKLFAGSMGTLGVLTELTFKIRPLPPDCGMLVFQSDHAAQWRQLQEALLDSPLEPCAAELVSPSLAADLFGSPVPAFMVLFEDVAPSVQYQLGVVRSLAVEIGFKAVNEFRGREQTELVIDRLRNIVPDAGTVPADRLAISVKLMTAPMDVPAVWEQVSSSAASLGFTPEFSGGIVTGVSYVTVRSEWERLDEVTGWLHQLRAEMERLQGAAVIMLAPQRVRSAASVWGAAGGSLKLMEGIKRQMDPAGILNCGRFAGGI